MYGITLANYTLHHVRYYEYINVAVRCCSTEPIILRYYDDAV